MVCDRIELFMKSMLFNTIMNDVIKLIKSQITPENVEYKNLQPMIIPLSVFADDVAIIERSEEEIEENIKILCEP